MDEQPIDREQWNEALSNASKHVVDRREAEAEAHERQKPQSQTPMLVAALVVLALVAAWNVQQLRTPPESMPEANERVHLIWFVTDAVELIEDFQLDQGRLPNAAEALDLLEEDVTYTAQGDEGYMLVVEGDAARLEYSSSTSLNDWLAQQAVGGGSGP